MSLFFGRIFPKRIGILSERLALLFSENTSAELRQLQLLLGTLHSRKLAKKERSTSEESDNARRILCSEGLCSRQQSTLPVLSIALHPFSIHPIVSAVGGKIQLAASLSSRMAPSRPYTFPAIVSFLSLALSPDLSRAQDTPAPESQLETVEAPPEASLHLSPTSMRTQGQRLKARAQKSQEQAFGKKAQESLSGKNETGAPVGVAPSEDTFPGAWKILDSSWYLRVGGMVQATGVMSWTPIRTKNRFTTPSIPTDDTSLSFEPFFKLTPQWSRVSLDARSDFVFGLTRAFIEMDFDGEDKIEPNLRHAFAQMGPVLAGQSWTSFMDFEVLPETVDFEGPAGITYLHQTQIRLMLEPLPFLDLEFSIEQSSSAVETSTDETRTPDGIVAAKMYHPAGHIRAAFVGGEVRALPNGLTTPLNSLRWGAQLSGSTTFRQGSYYDDLSFQFTVGEGVGHYLTGTAALPGADAWFDTVSGRLHSTPVFGGSLALRHWWSQRFRSSFTYSFSQVLPISEQPDSSYRYSLSTSVNLMYSPVPSADIGLEQLLGTRVDKGGASGSATQTQLSARVFF